MMWRMDSWGGDCVSDDKVGFFDMVSVRVGVVARKAVPSISTGCC